MDKTKTSAVDILILPDCLALTENGGCSLLKKKQCIGAECCFAHTADDVSADAHWKKRLLSLSDEEQTKIAKKYYGGLMPWR